MVTIKPADPAETDRSYKISPGYFSARHATFTDLLKFAYEVKSENQIIGAPDWTTKELFDVEAKAGATIADQFKDLPPERKIEPTRLMVQSMLAERFHLITSFKSKDLPAYALVIAKRGPKLKHQTVSPSPTGAENSASSRSPDVPHAPTLYMTDAHRLTGTNAPMNMLIGWLEHRPELEGRVIVD
ncbi:MAG: TIGR03435 family protein, partial [Acidobacteriales bacterium]|nr:TIGR03435 family protein [Terriglobales bacterium]